MQDALVAAQVITLEDRDPDRRLRDKWSQNLYDHLVAQGHADADPRHKRKAASKLQALLAERGVSVSRQAAEAWLTGLYAPRPSHQAHIAAVLRVPAHSLFPIELVA